MLASALPCNYWGVFAWNFVAAGLLEELGAPESWVSATALYDPLHPWRENPNQWDPYLVNQHIHPLLHYHGCGTRREGPLAVAPH